mgnify:CR=1 FL=1
MVGKEESVVRFKQRFIQTTQRILLSTQLPMTETITPVTTIRLDPMPEKLAILLPKIKRNRSFSALHLLNEQRDTEVARLSRDLLPSMALSASVVQSMETSSRISASIALPFQNKQAKARVEMSKLTKKKTAFSTESTTQQLLTTIQNLHLALITQKTLVDTAIKKKSLAADILKSESENYAYGKIELNDYIQAVNRYDTSRFDEIDQKITYQQLSVEWKRITDQLVAH